MSNEKKYYVPSIEEFHVGFEYEIQDLHLKGVFREKEEDWIPTVFSKLTTISDLWYCLSYEDLVKGALRVKYLDREDIEAEGWVRKQLPHQYFLETYMLVDVKHGEYSIMNLRYEDNIFRGTIRNRSELRRIMKMVGIKKENND